MSNILTIIISIISINLISVSSSCNWIQLIGGPRIAIDVCMNFHSYYNSTETGLEIYNGSYKFVCGVFYPYFQIYDGFNCNGNPLNPNNGPIVNGIDYECDIGGGVCTHAIIRRYSHRNKRSEINCLDNDNNDMMNNPYLSFTEEALVTGCWSNNDINPNLFSWRFSCDALTNDNKYQFSFYKNSADCNGKSTNISYVTDGCKFDEHLTVNWTKLLPYIGNVTILNYTNINIANLFNLSNVNNSYWQINECSFGTDGINWLAIIMGAICGLFCCFCCCFLVAFCSYRCNRKKNNNQSYVNQQSGLLDNDGNNVKIVTTEGTPVTFN